MWRGGRICRAMADVCVASRVTCKSRGGRVLAPAAMATTTAGEAGGGCSSSAISVESAASEVEVRLSRRCYCWVCVRQDALRQGREQPSQSRVAKTRRERPAEAACPQKLDTGRVGNADRL